MSVARKIVEQAGGLYIRLPTDYLDTLGWRKGDTVAIQYVHDHLEIRRMKVR